MEHVALQCVMYRLEDSLVKNAAIKSRRLKDIPGEKHVELELLCLTIVCKAIWFGIISSLVYLKSRRSILLWKVILVISY